MSFSNRDFMLLDQRLFKAFMAAAQTQSFTHAATRAHMTQSGVSQHIAKLEEQIGVTLFKRIGKKVVLTDAGNALMHYVRQQMHSTQQFMDRVHAMETRVAGLVSYAMPPSCLMSPHFPMLLERRRAHPDIELNITLTSTQEVVRMLLENQADFGFVTENNNHPLLRYRLFCQEEYVLVSSNPASLQDLTDSSILEQRFIWYPGSSYYYDRWLKHVFPERCNLNTYSLTFAGEINSINGAIDMVAGGLGMAVIPCHCVASLLEQGRLYRHQASQPLLNDIHIITIKDHEYPRRVEQVIDWFFDMVADK